MRHVVSFIPETDDELAHPLAGSWVVVPVPRGDNGLEYRRTNGTDDEEVTPDP